MTDKKEENLPATTGNNALAQVTSGGTGLEQFGAEDQQIPRIVIVQPTSKIGTAGKYRNSLLDAEDPESQFAEFRAVFLAMSKSRVLFGDELGTDPLCRSFDALNPAPDIDKPPCKICAEETSKGHTMIKCPRAMWPRDYAKFKGITIEEAIKYCYGNKTAKPPADISKTPPACQLSINLLGLDIREQVGGAPFMISFRRNTLKNVRNFLQHCTQYAARHKRALRHCEVTLALKEQPTSKGKYFVPIFKEAKWLDEKNTDELKRMMEYQSMFEALSGQNISDLPSGGIDESIESEESITDGDEVPF